MDLLNTMLNNLENVRKLSRQIEEVLDNGTVKVEKNGKRTVKENKYTKLRESVPNWNCVTTLR